VPSEPPPKANKAAANKAKADKAKANNPEAINPEAINPEANNPEAIEPGVSRLCHCMYQLPRNLIAQRFSRAANTYCAHAQLQRSAQDELIERLILGKQAPKTILDVGAGPGLASAALVRKFPKAQVIALDLSLAMLRAAKSQLGWFRRFERVCADMHALPIADQSIDLVYSNLALQWSDDLPRVFAELRRVMRPGALLLFSSFGPDTLRELRAAWATIDDEPHVHGFADLPYHGDQLLAAGFRDPVVDNLHVTRGYSDVMALMRELKGLGANRVLRGQRRGLYGRGTLKRLSDAYRQIMAKTMAQTVAQTVAKNVHAAAPEATITATWELLFGMGFAPEPGQAVRIDGVESASFPVEHLLRRKPIARP